MIQIRVDFRSGIPITDQIAQQIQGLIASGVLRPGDQLPTVRALATELRVNFNTVARAYRMLDEAGVISTQRGRGTYILEKPPPETAARLRREALRALGQQYLSAAEQLGFSAEEALRFLRTQVQKTNS